MSADNWAICPKCKKMALDKQYEQLVKIRKKYGEMSPDEYEAAIFATNTPIELDETLREDYEFHIDEEGLFSAEYSARCDRCGFKHSFKHSEEIKIRLANGITACYALKEGIMESEFEHCKGCVQLNKKGTKCRSHKKPASDPHPCSCKYYESPSSRGEARGISGRFATKSSQRSGNAWCGNRNE